jgi:predicted nuclease of predicted toxin-antitoxin system
MKFKTDENLPTDATAILMERGYDAASVHEQQLAGHPDNEIAIVCRSEERVIVTMDLDFADIRNFPPADYFGIIILRPEVNSIPRIGRLLLRAIAALDDQPIVGRLWIVEEHRIRVRE